ncbi:DUF6449 domain-containing protein [Butyrivibrio sp. AE3004]|uniref:DUF6449 domain-containing protein n=1 Tax=Butyrivibrio sp. AE3004 TaxID=1506994 RepID=UPI0004948051|nr:DUF6449 domain-containing protein [Butyrivibrio sp. AE3004]
MTSRKLFVDLLKENSKRRLWPIALSVAANFFAQIVYAMLMFGHYKSRLENNATTITDIRIDFYNNTAGMGNVPVLLIVCAMAFILALQGYYYLFDSRQTDLYYSLPIKREKLFDVNNLCGILIFVVPYAVCHLITVILGLSRGYVTWDTILLFPASALVVICMFIMCYELCCLACVLTGHVVVATLGCAVFFFMGPVVKGVYEILMATFFSSYFSYNSISGILLAYSPIKLMTDAIAAFHGDAANEIAFYTFDAAASMIKIFLLAIFSYLFARVLIVKRPAEAAGKSMAFYITKPVLKILVSVTGSLGTGILMYYVSNSRNLGMFVFGIVCGLVVIHIVIETIYEFDFKACFKNYATLITSAVISAAVFAIFVFDIFGYETWQPMPSKVESVAIGDSFVYSELIAPYSKIIDQSSGYTYYGGSSSGTEYALRNMKLTDFENVEKLTRKGAVNARQIHKEGLKYHEFGPDYIYYDNNNYDELEYPDYEFFTIQWNLKNGKKVRRKYRLNLKDEEIFTAFTNLYNSDEYKVGKFPVYGITKGEINALKGNTVKGDYGKTFSDDEMAEFLKAYSDDIKGQTYEDLEKENPTMMLYGCEEADVRDYYSYNKYNFYIFPSFVNTIAFMEKYNMPVTWWEEKENINYLKVEMEHWDEEQDENIHAEWSSREKSEIDSVMDNVIPTELFNVSGAGFLSDYYEKGWKHVEVGFDTDRSSYSQDFYLINSEKLPEKLKNMCFLENGDNASAYRNESETGSLGWMKCVTNG